MRHLYFLKDHSQPLKRDWTLKILWLKVYNKILITYQGSFRNLKVLRSPNSVLTLFYWTGDTLTLPFIQLEIKRIFLKCIASIGNVGNSSLRVLGTWMEIASKTYRVSDVLNIIRRDISIKSLAPTNTNCTIIKAAYNAMITNSRTVSNHAARTNPQQPD